AGRALPVVGGARPRRDCPRRGELARHRRDLAGPPPTLAAVAHVRWTLRRRPLRGGRALRRGTPRLGAPEPHFGGCRGGEGVKYVFILVLLIVAGAGGLMGLVVGIRWRNNMTQTPRLMPGERNFSMPAGVVPRGGELVVPKEQRDVAARQPNPIRPTPESVTIGRQHFQTFCS